jgi:hypothetical protein
MSRTPVSYIGLSYKEITEAFIATNHTSNDPSLGTLHTIDKKWRRIGQETKSSHLGAKY